MGLSVVMARETSAGKANGHRLPNRPLLQRSRRSDAMPFVRRFAQRRTASGDVGLPLQLAAPERINRARNQTYSEAAVSARGGHRSRRRHIIAKDGLGQFGADLRATAMLLLERAKLSYVIAAFFNRMP